MEHDPGPVSCQLSLQLHLEQKKVITNERKATMDHNNKLSGSDSSICQIIMAINNIPSGKKVVNLNKKKFKWLI